MSDQRGQVASDQRGQVPENMICMQLCVYGIVFFIPTSVVSLLGRGCDCVVTGVGD